MGFFKESMFNRKCIWNKLIEYIYKFLKIHHVPNNFALFYGWEHMFGRKMKTMHVKGEEVAHEVSCGQLNYEQGYKSKLVALLAVKKVPGFILFEFKII